MDDKKTDWLAVGKRLAVVVWVAVKATAKAVAWVAKHTFNGSIAAIAAIATVFVEINRNLPTERESSETYGEASIDLYTGEYVYARPDQEKLNHIYSR